MRKLAVLWACATVLTAFAQPPLIPRPTSSSSPAGSGNTVLVFLPQQIFSGTEYEQVTRTLAREGVYFRLVAADTSICVGTNRVIVSPDLALPAVEPAASAGLVLIGGPGQTLYWDDSLLHATCRDFAAAGKVLAGIGTAPITLARAGVLQGRRAAVTPDPYAVKYVREHGARYSFKPLEVDGRIVTAAGSDQAANLAMAVARLVLKPGKAP